MMSSILIALLVSAPSAHAEGSAELPGQWLVIGNELYVDIFDPDSESIRFDGAGSMAVRAPDGTDLGSLISGAELSLNGLPAGAYLLEPLREQRGDWDISVVGATDSGGRLHAYVWETRWPVQPQWRHAPDLMARRLGLRAVPVHQAERA